MYAALSKQRLLFTGNLLRRDLRRFATADATPTPAPESMGHSATHAEAGGFYRGLHHRVEAYA